MVTVKNFDVGLMERLPLGFCSVRCFLIGKFDSIAIIKVYQIMEALYWRFHSIDLKRSIVGALGNLKHFYHLSWHLPICI